MILSDAKQKCLQSLEKINQPGKMVQAVGVIKDISKTFYRGWEYGSRAPKLRRDRNSYGCGIISVDAIFIYSPAEDRATLESDLSADRGARCRGRGGKLCPFFCPGRGPQSDKVRDQGGDPVPLAGQVQGSGQ
ncbi:MAG: hypothetical protein ABSC45_11990, partial [Desulfobaccales bacterium]